MKRFKSWILNKFLPAYAKDLLNELKEENEILKHTIREQQAYINGLQAGHRHTTKIYNNYKGGDK